VAQLLAVQGDPAPDVSLCSPSVLSTTSRCVHPVHAIQPIAHQLSSVLTHNALYYLLLVFSFIVRSALWLLPWCKGSLYHTPCLKKPDPCDFLA